MNHKYLLVFISLFWVNSIMSQVPQVKPWVDPDPAISENDIFSNKESVYTKSLFRIIAELEKSIEIRMRDLEAKHDQLAVLRPDLRNVQTIVTEDLPFTYDEGYESNLFKYITFSFKDGKLSEIKLGSRKKRIQYEFAFENKTMIFSPPKVGETKIVLERFDKTENTVLKDISYDNQIRALRLMEASLRTSLYRMDVMIVLYKENKDRRNLYQIQI